MKLTYPVYITIEAKDVHAGQKKIEGMMLSELLLPVSWSIGRPILTSIADTKSADSFDVRGPAVKWSE